MPIEGDLGLAAATRVAEAGAVGPALVQLRALCVALRTLMDARFSMLALKRGSLAAWGWLPIDSIGQAEPLEQLTDIEVEQLVNMRKRISPPAGFKAYVLRFLPHVRNPRPDLWDGEWTTTQPGTSLSGLYFQLEGPDAVRG